MRSDTSILVVAFYEVEIWSRSGLLVVLVCFHDVKEIYISWVLTHLKGTGQSRPGVHALVLYMHCVPRVADVARGLLLLT